MKVDANLHMASYTRSYIIYKHKMMIRWIKNCWGWCLKWIKHIYGDSRQGIPSFLFFFASLTPILLLFLHSRGTPVCVWICVRVSVIGGVRVEKSFPTNNGYLPFRLFRDFTQCIVIEHETYGKMWSCENVTISNVHRTLCKKQFNNEGVRKIYECIYAILQCVKCNPMIHYIENSMCTHNPIWYIFIGIDGGWW